MVMLALLTLSGCEPERSTRCDSLPPLVIWSWTSDDRLQFLNSTKTAVAYYAGTIMLGRSNATLLRRRNALVLNASTLSFPVFRMEQAHVTEPVSAASFDQALLIIKDYVEEKHARFVQIDFDARENDRAAYLIFLKNLRARLPANVGISITALASWCLDDKWLNHAPIDESVAMMFSMGPGKNDAFSAMRNQRIDSGAASAQSVGVSINEVETNSLLHKAGYLQKEDRLRCGPRIYAFSSLGWNAERYQNLLKEVEK